MQREYNINHLAGEVIALRALVLGLANLTVGPLEFRAQSVERLAAARNALLDQPVPERMLEGIDAVEAWLLHVTG